MCTFLLLNHCVSKWICSLIRFLKFCFLSTFPAVVFILLNQWSLTSFKRMFEHKELVEGTWPWAYQALCFSCGYFAYDQQDMLQYRLYSGFIPSILIHHLVLLICFTLALYRHITINYLILTLICEVCFNSFSAKKLRELYRLHMKLNF